jgi:hypothetical protein
MPNILKYLLLVLSIIIFYGFYEKDRRENLYIAFYENRPLDCDGDIVRLGNGWKIHHNRFFTNGKELKTIVFCKETD